MSTHCNESINLRSLSAVRNSYHVGMNSHMVQCWCNVSHQAHEKEGHLQDLVGDEIQAIDHFIIPRHRLETEEKRQDPYRRFDGDDLT